jgi:hypothetical protein
MFRALRHVGQAARDRVAGGGNQYQQPQWQAQQYDNALLPGGDYHDNTDPSEYYHDDPYPQQRQDPPLAWPLLINADKTPTPLFARMLDAIFDLARSADTNTTSQELLTPTRVATVYKELGYSPQDNLPALLFQAAQNSGDKTRVNEGMKMAWQIFELEYTTTTGNVPGLTKQGFRDMMVRDALIYPPGQAMAYNALLGKHKVQITRYAKGEMFPAGDIATECFMPTGVPESGDVETQRVYRERQGVWGREYSARFPPET